MQSSDKHLDIRQKLSYKNSVNLSQCENDQCYLQASLNAATNLLYSRSLSLLGGRPHGAVIYR